MKSLFNKIIITAIIIFAAGCSESSKEQNTEIIGMREAYKIEINKPNSIHQSLIIKDYGFANINVEADSAVELNFSIFKDVKVKEQILGVEREITLIKAKYSSMRRGKLHKESDSLYTFICRREKSGPIKIYFVGNKMFTEFTDSDSTVYKLSF